MLPNNQPDSCILDCPAIALVVDRGTCRIVETTDTATRYYGYQPAEMLDLSLTDLSIYDNGSGPARRILTAKSHEQFFTDRHRLSTGDVRDVRMSAMPTSYAGRPALRVVIHDVTELVGFARSLREQRDFEETLLETIPCPVFYKDREGHYLGCNEAFASYLGKTQQQIVEKTVFDIAKTDFARVYQQADEELFANPGTQVYETRIPHADGTIHDIVLHKATYFNDHGEVAGLIGVILDITDRKRAEEAALSAKLEAERANQTKSRFLAAASHDLRQPLQAMIMYLGALRGSESSPANLTIINQLERSVATMSEILNALLDMSRLETGIIKPEIQEFPVMDLLKRVQNTVAPQAADKAIELRIVPCSLRVRSDPVLLERIVANLAHNAVRYTEKGKVLIGCRRGGEHLKIEVWDTGIGIHDHDQVGIFEEFVQLGNPARQFGKGMGLGLFIVDRLARLLQHPLRLSSKFGQGSMFSVSVPSVIESDITNPETENGASVAGQLTKDTTILIIDDDPVVVHSTSALMTQWGYTVLTATDSHSALTLIKKMAGHPDLVITDYRLPGDCNGLDLARQLRRLLGEQLPVLFLTGDTLSTHLADELGFGSRLLCKPVTPDTLQRNVTEMLWNRTTMEQL